MLSFRKILSKFRSFFRSNPKKNFWIFRLQFNFCLMLFDFYKTPFNPFYSFLFLLIQFHSISFHFCLFSVSKVERNPKIYCGILHVRIKFHVNQNKLKKFQGTNGTCLFRLIFYWFDYFSLLKPIRKFSWNYC